MTRPERLTRMSLPRSHERAPMERIQEVTEGDGRRVDGSREAEDLERGTMQAQDKKPDIPPEERARPFAYINQALQEAVQEAVLLHVRGRILEVSGTIIKAAVPAVRIGELCLLGRGNDTNRLSAEVVGFTDGVALLTPIGEMQGLSSVTEVQATGRVQEVPVGRQLLGRVLDGLGSPADGMGPIRADKFYPVYAPAPAPMSRQLITDPLPLGIRALDGVLTMGRGQRMGIFAAAGGGKSTLLSAIIRGTEADVSVLSLIGERGREVREFIEQDLGEEGLRRAVVVCATSDRSPMERAKAAYVATTIAEYFRDQGQRVLLLMDSVTRFARAQREIGLSAGEPPTRRGFPPSVFTALPRLMERAGNNDKGSISALYTVLVEGDDMTEPVADETRSILDGHIILSRQLASANHYPAIDILASASRTMNKVVGEDHLEAAGKLRSMLAKYAEAELLIKIGEYKSGSDPKTDEAIRKISSIQAFLQQKAKEITPFSQSLSQLKEIVR